MLQKITTMQNLTVKTIGLMGKTGPVSTTRTKRKPVGVLHALHG